MRRSAVRLGSSAIVATLLVLPFVSLEVMNRRRFDEQFPIVLFGSLWVLAMTFFLALRPILERVRPEGTVRARPVALLVGVAYLILVAWLWVAILLDQMPCFLGVPNCD